MYNASAQLFNSVAASVRTEIAKLSTTELVRYYQKHKDDNVFALIASRVFGIAANVCNNKGCYIYGQDETDAAFDHCILYAVNHYKPTNTAKFETFFQWCAVSTYSQMHQTNSASKRKQLNNSQCLEDIQFMVPDETALVEQAVLLEDVKRVIRQSTFCSLRDKARALGFVKVVQENPSGLTSEELCIELRLFKDKSGKNDLETQKLLVEKYDRLVKEKGEEKITEGLLKRNGIICDLEALQDVRDDLKAIIDEMGIVDVAEYEDRCNRLAMRRDIKERVNLALKEEAHRRGVTHQDMIDAYKAGNYQFNTRVIVADAASRFNYKGNIDAEFERIAI